MDPSVENLCNLLARSKLLSAEDVRRLHQQWHGTAGAAAHDVDRFRQWLVDNQHVTEFQISQLVRGHADHIFFGEYKLLDRIGRGRMAGVYKAVHQLGQVVAIKVLPPSKAKDPQSLARFQREARLAMKLKHPNVVRSFQVGEYNGLHYLVMEYLEGETLDVVLQRRKRLPPQEAVRLIYQALMGLQHIHEQGLVHRDLKPANLMVVDPDSPYEHIKVMDFGLAKLLQPFDLQAISVTGTEFAIGTPGYMCPEQAKGEEMDHRGDLYSVGVILYEMLTGRLPFSGASTMEVLIAHATEPPPSFTRVGAADWVPPAVEAVIMACLAKDPEQRPANARELAERYEAALAQEQALQQKAAAEPSRAVPPRAEAAPKEAVPTDPYTVVHRLEAWMPEAIAAYKLRGFVQDAGGEVLESVPGRIRVRLGGKGSVYAASGRGSWFGLGRKSSLIDLELKLQRSDPHREGLLQITIVLRPADRSGANGDWQDRCAQVFCDLRGYLMGQSGTA
jgi:serine/threonine-protein kinase